MPKNKNSDDVLKSTPQQLVAEASECTTQYVALIWAGKRSNDKVEKVSVFYKKGLDRLRKAANQKFNDNL